MPTKRETSEFLLRACHDLRTPLRGVRAHSELLQRHLKDREALPAEVHRSLDFVLDGARKADLIVDGIAAYATALQIDPSHFLPTRLDVTLRAALVKLDSALQQEGAEVRYSELPRVSGDPDRLAELFERIIRNALDHRGSEAPRIQVCAAQADNGWRLTVQNNGPGVASSELENIFRPFQKLHGTGAGMGLAACRAIVAAHGGRIWAESPSFGLAIVFTLPA
jgi:signal transduction histidine kinase